MKDDEFVIDVMSTMNATSRDSDEDNEDEEPPPPKRIPHKSEFIAGLLTSTLEIFLKRVHECDVMINDKGKHYFLALIDLVCFFRIYDVSA